MIGFRAQGTLGHNDHRNVRENRACDSSPGYSLHLVIRVNSYSRYFVACPP